jgi:hypothetical protein
MEMMMLSMAYCEKHAMRALVAFKNSPRLANMGTSIILPNSIKGWCIKMQMPVGTRTLNVSLAVAPDRCGNRAEFNEVGPNRPPSTMEILLENERDFPDLDSHLGYDQDVQSFGWSSDPRADEDGFADVIDEIVRLRAVLDDGDASAFENIVFIPRL